MNKLALLVLFSAALFSTAGFGRSIYSYKGSVDARVGEHVGPRSGLATERGDFRFLQNATYSNHLKGALGFSGWYEGVYSQYSQVYSQEVRHDDATDLRLRDLFVQYQFKSFFVKAGNQQVVWGEAFGAPYSDIVNPRDLRDGGIGDLADVRLQTPMLNAKFISSSFSVQGIYIPQAHFNILPSPTNDYSYPYEKFLNGASLEILQHRQQPWSSNPGEYGSRVTALLGHWDLSAFYFGHYDRSPTYKLNSATTQQITIEEIHSRVDSYGFTATNDFGGFLVRSEVMMMANRRFPTLTNGNLSSVKADNPAYVIGVDLPTLQDWNITVQWSQDFVEGNAAGLLRNKNQSLISTRLSRTLFREHEFELIAAHSMVDAGSRAQLKYAIPISRQSEVRAGSDFFLGPFKSDLGKYDRANRIFVIFRYQFAG